jgi:peptidoglycan/LPS O-acetylase OafA/YrhL
VRGIAILLVLIAHAHVPGLIGMGTVGVTVFFALSGFLITSLLLEERARSGRVSMRGFYRRRAVRLLPALPIVLVLALAVDMVTTGRVADWHLFIGALTYSTNWIQAAGSGYANSPLTHMWSLAVEEQFYLVWPVVLLALVRLPRRWQLALLAALAGAAVLVRVVSFDSARETGHYYFGTDARADALLVGAALAIALHGASVRSVSPLCPIAALLAVVWCGVQPHGFRAVWAPLVVALATAAIIAVVCWARAPWLEARWLRWFGARSYGIYLFHMPLWFAAVWLLGDGASWWLVGLVMLPASLAAAELSWRLVEKPAQRWREPRLRRAARGMRLQERHEVAALGRGQFLVVDQHE